MPEVHCKFATSFYKIKPMKTQHKTLDSGYKAMAADTQYEADATEWIGGLQSDKSDQFMTPDELRLEPTWTGQKLKS